MHEGRYCVWKLVTDNRMLNNVISLVFKMNRLSLLLKVIDNKIKTIFFPLNCVTEPGQREIYLARIIFKPFFLWKIIEKRALLYALNLSLCRCGIFKAQYKDLQYLWEMYDVLYQSDISVMIATYSVPGSHCRLNVTLNREKIKGIPNYVIKHI